MKVEPVFVGDVVRFVDSQGSSYYALVIAVNGDFSVFSAKDVETYSVVGEYKSVPSVNLVYADYSKTDVVEKISNVPHFSKQPKNGMFWTNVV